MNRQRVQKKYIFKPPKYSGFLAPLIYLISDIYYLRCIHKIAEVSIAYGGQEVLDLCRNGNSLLITPNHSDHSDPHVLLHLNRGYKIPVHFIAAREVFEVNHGINGKVLQRAGVFSIDREGADVKAIKEAMRIVYEAKYPLVMFPEGEIYHLNEKLTPLNEGAATIMLKTVKRLEKEKKNRGCYIVPTAMRYTYVGDISQTFSESMDKLEKHLQWKPQRHLDIVERIYQFGEALLSVKEKEVLKTVLDGSLPERLNECREIIIAEIELKYFSNVGEGTHPERIRKARGKIRSALLNDQKPLTPDASTGCYIDLDKLYFATQLYSYPGQYIRERPTDDRIAETILKFEEDVFGEYQVKGKRKSIVTFCKPINMYDYHNQFKSDPKTTVGQVTARIESAIRDVLESA